MSSDVWIGAVISIPVSLLVALAVPRVQRWLDKSGEKSHEKKRERIRDEYLQVLHYALHTDLLIGHMLVTAITLIAFVFVFLVGQMVVPAVGDAIVALLHPSAPSISDPHAVVVVFIVLLSIWLAGTTAWVASVLNMAWRYVKLFFNVRFIRSYVDSIPGDIRDLDIERLVLRAAQERAIPASSWHSICSECSKAGKSSQPPTAPPKLDEPV